MGYSETELLSMSPDNLTYPGDRESHQALDDRLNHGEIDSYTTEKRYVRKDGKIIWVAVSVKLIKDRSGSPLRSIGAIKDITQRKEMEFEI